MFSVSGTKSGKKSILVKIICPSFSTVFTIGTNLNIGAVVLNDSKSKFKALPNVVYIFKHLCVYIDKNIS